MIKAMKEVCRNCGYTKEFFPIDLQLRTVECPRCGQMKLKIVR